LPNCLKVYFSQSVYGNMLDLARLLQGFFILL